MENNKETIWITIPEETVPASSLPQEERSESSDKVRNKAFWGAGFVALLVFTVMLFAPKQFVQLLQGQLFDGGFQIVPDYEEQQDQGELFGGDEDMADNAEDTGASVQSADNQTQGNVVEAQGDAVSIQIEPLADTDAEVSDELTDGDQQTAVQTQQIDEVQGGTEVQQDTQVQDTVTAETEVMAETEAQDVSTDQQEAVQVEVQPVSEVQAVTEAEMSDEDTSGGSGGAFQTELDSLNAQLAEFKQKEEDNQKLIEQLVTMLQQGGQADLHGAATQVSPSLLGNQQADGATQTAQAGGYRYNTHTVTVSPYDVLKQNQGFQAQAYQANTQSVGVQAYSNQNYNPVLSGVQGQPDTGPAETILIALLLASVGVLIWGSWRAARA